MKNKILRISGLLALTGFLSSCYYNPALYPSYTSGVSVSASTYVPDTSQVWVSDTYDSTGFPIYGYNYGRPVYGYTSAGVAIFTLGALTALSCVPDWGYASWYRGSYRYPSHIRRYHAPPRYPKNHRPNYRPSHKPSYHPSHKPSHGSSYKPNYRSNNTTIINNTTVNKNSFNKNNNIKHNSKHNTRYNSVTKNNAIKNTSVRNQNNKSAFHKNNAQTRPSSSTRPSKGSSSRPSGANRPHQQSGKNPRHSRS